MNLETVFNPFKYQMSSVFLLLIKIYNAFGNMTDHFIEIEGGLGIKLFSRSGTASCC